MKKLKEKIIIGLLDWKYRMERAWGDERGDTHIIAIILVLIVLIALAVIFKDQLIGIVNNLFGRVNDDLNNF